MKAIEIFKLAEMMANSKKEDKPMKRPRRVPRHMYRLPEPDLAALLHKKLEEAATIEKILNDREKANKKEDKKKSGLSMVELTMLLIASYPIIGLAWLLTHR